MVQKQSTFPMRRLNGRQPNCKGNLLAERPAPVSADFFAIQLRLPYRGDERCT